MPYDSIDLNLRYGRTRYFNLIHKQTEKIKFRRKLTQFNTYLRTYGLNLKRIEIDDNIQNETNDFKLDITEAREELDLVSICQIARDKANISERKYKILRKNLMPIGKLANLAQCNQYKKSLNEKFWQVIKNSTGFYVFDVLEKLTFVCNKFYNRLETEDSELCRLIKEKKTLDIMICGDGIQCTKTRVNILNFCFSIIDEKLLNMKLKKHYEEMTKAEKRDFKLKNNIGLYTLGLFKCEKESYDNIEVSLKEIIEQLKHISEIVINDLKIKVNFYLGGDLKWISSIMGIKAANSSHPCPWCKWELRELSKEKLTETLFDEAVNHMTNEVYEISDRSHQEAQNNIGQMGYKHLSLFQFIPFDNVVIDILHLTLRISDKLFFILLMRLEELEGDSSADLNKRPLTKIFIDFINEKTSIRSVFYFKSTRDKKNNETSSFKLRKLPMKDRLTIINAFESVGSLRNIFECQNHHNDVMLIRLSRLFGMFKNIIQVLRKDNSENFEKESLNIDLKKWFHIYLKTGYNVTPYIHAFCFHIPQFIEKHGNLNCFSMQNLEKYNHIDKINYFQSTNRHTESFLSTLLEKMNRLEYIRLSKL